MSDKTRLGLALLGSALFLGLLGVLRATPLGLNAFLWVAALCAVVVVLAELMGSGVSGGRLWMIPTLLLLPTTSSGWRTRARQRAGRQ